MKKVIKLILFGIFFLCTIKLICAGSIGISPGGDKIYFEPGLKKVYSYTISSPEPNQEIRLYLAGDLKEYANLTKNSVKGSGSFNVELNLPQKLETPGKHELLIGGIESNENESDRGVGIGGIAAIQVAIQVFVPYPGKYAEAQFDIFDVNEGEKADYYFEINNLGTEDINSLQKIEISDSNNNVVLTKDLGYQSISSKKKITIDGTIESENFKPGIYNVKASVDYGKIINFDKTFKVGHFFVNITDYSYMFEESKINKFKIEAQNLWNSKLSDVHAEVSISDNGKILDKFKTPSSGMFAWEKTNFSGFFDATKIKQGKYLANIIIFYGNESSNKLVYIYVNKIPIDRQLVFIVSGISLFVILMFSIIIYLIIKLKRVQNEKKKKK